MGQQLLYANRSLCLANGREANLIKWPLFGSNEFPLLFCSFPPLADCHHNRAHSEEGHNLSFEILTHGETYILSLVPLKVAEIIAIFKMIYSNY